LSSPHPTKSLTRGRGLTLLVFSSLTFGVMAYTTKQATRRLDGAQVASIRFAIGLAVTALWAALRGMSLRPVRVLPLFLRGFFGGIAVLLYFLSIAALPVGTATLLNYTAPVFTAIFAGTFLHERLPRGSYAAMAIAGAGVVLVVRGQGEVLRGAYTWQAIALGSAIASGAAVTAIRLARRTDNAWVVFGWFCLVGLLCTTPLAIARWKAPTLSECWLLLMVGALSVIAQVLMTHALGAVEAATGGIIAQITVITALSLGYFFDDEPIARLSLAGAALTILGVSLAARVSARTLPGR
jgi:drug/metabolite transporter (DMT)-like permease